MVNTFRSAPMAALAVTLAVPTLANAQDIFLATGGADLTWHGTATGAKAGIWMDIGAVSNDTRRDLIVGAPGTSGTSGTVYVIFGGPDRTGDRSLSLADRSSPVPTPGTASVPRPPPETSGIPKAPRHAILSSAPRAPCRTGVRCTSSAAVSLRAAPPSCTANAVFTIPARRPISSAPRWPRVTR